MKSFSTKVAVITGAGSGMGRYLAVLLAKAGADVAICEINQTTLAETEKMIKAYPVNVSSHVLDVADKAAIEALPAQVIEQHGHVDGLMFFSKDRLKEVGRYSEEYHYDCECQDYCLTMMLHGYNNYLVKLNYEHFKSSPIIKKPEQSRSISRKKLEKKWKNLQKKHEDKNLVVHGSS